MTVTGELKALSSRLDTAALNPEKMKKTYYLILILISE